MDDAAVRRAGRLGLIAATAFILYGTTIPWRFDLDPSAVARRFGSVDWAVVHVVGGRLRGLPDIVANCLFFVPLGASYAMARGLTRVAPAAVGGLLLGAALSCVVEALQLLTVDRTTQLGDVVFNASGCAAAAGLTARFQRRLPALMSSAMGRWFRSTPAHAAFALVAFAIALRSLAPFDVSIDVGSVKSSIKAFLDAPLGLAGPAEAVVVGVPFLILGFVAADVVPGPRWRALLACVALAGSLEGAQVFVASRTPGVGEVLAAGLGAAVGLLARPLGAAAARPAILALVAMAAAEALAPFTLATPESIEARATSQSLVPFAAYYADLRQHVLDDVIDQALPYVLLGALLASRFGGRRAVLLATGVGVVLEGAQIFVATRVVDVGDVVLAALGASLGAAAHARVHRAARGDATLPATARA